MREKSRLEVEPAVVRTKFIVNSSFFTQKIFYHYNVYIIMIFLIFILKDDDINVYKIF